MLAYFRSPIFAEEYTLFNAVPGDPVFESENELLAIVVAVKLFGPILRQLGVSRNKRQA